MQELRGIIDTHTHYDDGRFDEDREALFSSLSQAGLLAVVNAASTVASWEDNRRLAERFPLAYYMIGVHPDEVGELTEERFAQMEALLEQEKAVAVGEIGLDYYWDRESRDLQKSWFLRQLKLANRRDKAVSIHSREASKDTFELLKQYGKDLRLVLHCYSGSPEIAREYVKMGYYLGIGGVVTFKNGRRLQETVAAVPLSSLVLETDCPYLAPEPFRGSRNTSLNLPYVARRIGEIKGVEPEEVVRVTTENARKLFGLPRTLLGAPGGAP